VYVNQSITIRLFCHSLFSDVDEAMLRKKIQELQHSRRMGLTTASDIDKYENDVVRRVCSVAIGHVRAHVCCLENNIITYFYYRPKQKLICHATTTHPNGCRNYGRSVDVNRPFPILGVHILWRESRTPEGASTEN
jgi:hypothetical protein